MPVPATPQRKRRLVHIPVTVPPLRPADGNQQHRIADKLDSHADISEVTEHGDYHKCACQIDPAKTPKP